ncbi:helix-turn-helix domain-containing protein [Burkholderia savannae]|uniref:helix-turn-helix domain-containing protein n=1 Tax=Burkholderia savannae TaxID=1637837 RepID=UPI002F41F955
MSRWQGAFVGNSAGTRIRAVRGDRGVSEFAEALEVNRKTVTRWEADDTLPDGASLLRLKAKYGADPGWILTGEGEAPGTDTLTADERELLERYRAAPLAVKAAAVAALTAGTEPRRGKQQQVFRKEVGQAVQVEGDLNQQGISFFGKERKKK